MKQTNKQTNLHPTSRIETLLISVTIRPLDIFFVLDVGAFASDDEVPK